MNKRWILLVAACAVLAMPPLYAADMMPPDVLAKSVADEVLKAVRTDKDLASGNSQKVLQLVETKVLPHFDFEHMARLAMGRNWRQATPAQRKTITDEFRTMLVRTYAAAFTGYHHQTVQFRHLDLKPTDDDVVVKSTIMKPGAQPISVDYRMEKMPDGWKVYDVMIEGISLIENYRNTFASEIQRSGVDGLIKVLAEKNRSMMQAKAGGK